MKLLVKQVEVICGWCRKSFKTENQKDRFGEFPVRICPHCGTTVQASRKELTGNVVGRKRWKTPSQKGDIV